MTTSTRAGFSIIEMAVVLIIIGLLFGAGVVGRSLIRDAQLRNTVGSVAKYTLAVTNFSDKYKALPGDFNSAETLWGSDSTCPSTTYSTTLKAATCNGNGDGYIGAASGTYYETFRAWQQLSAAGMLDDNVSNGFNGVAGSGGALQAIPGINVPASNVPGGGFSIMYLSVASGGDANNYTYLHNHFFSLGSAIATSYTYGALLTPAEALATDSKLDDGVPGTGNVQPYKSTLNPNCTTSDDPTVATYKTSNSGIACALKFITSF